MKLIKPSCQPDVNSSGRNKIRPTVIYRKGTIELLVQKWAIQLAIDGDLRFVSHLDTARLVERTAARGGLPLRYSCGHNPRPIISLACPRPVGVATRDDLVVMSMDEPLQSEDLLERLNSSAPPGMSFGRAQQLEAKKPPRPLKAHYELPVDSETALSLISRLDELASQDAWPIERMVSTRGRGGRFTKRVIDIHPLVEALTVEEGILHVILVRNGDTWARPSEVLRLLGLDEQVDLAATVRTKLEFEVNNTGCSQAE